MRLVDPYAFLLKLYKITNSPYLYTEGMQQINIEELAVETPYIDSNELAPFCKENIGKLNNYLEKNLHNIRGRDMGNRMNKLTDWLDYLEVEYTLNNPNFITVYVGDVTVDVKEKDGLFSLHDSRWESEVTNFSYERVSNYLIGVIVNFSKGVSDGMDGTK